VHLAGCQLWRHSRQNITRADQRTPKKRHQIPAVAWQRPAFALDRAAPTGHNGHLPLATIKDRLHADS